MDIFYWDFMRDIEKVQEIIKKNAIVAGETDTIIGLFGNCTEQTYQILQIVKKREKKPFIILVASIEHAKKFVAIDQLSPFLHFAKLLWPGPYTIITKTNPPYFYAASQEKEIALRLPNNKAIQTFLEPFAGVFSTSANISGEPSPKSFDQLSQEIKENIAGYIKFREKPNKSAPSTILRLENQTITLLRGALPEEKQELLMKHGFLIRQL